MDGPRPADNVRAVVRALDLLKVFDAQHPEQTAAELLARVDLSRPTLYRLLQTLESTGFVASSGSPQRFRLGPAVAQLVHAWTANQDLAERARPMLARLWESTGETVSLFQRDGDGRVCVAELPSPQPLGFRRGVGYRAPIAVGASGRVIRAWLGEGAGGLSAAERNRIRAAGHAVSFGELIQGAVAIAAPVFDGSGSVIGAVTVFGPQVRMARPRIAAVARQVVDEAAAISAALGAVPPAGPRPRDVRVPGTSGRPRA